MFSNYPVFTYINPYMYNPYHPIWYPTYPYHSYGTMGVPQRTWDRQQPISGQATWTEGGPITECGVPWSTNEYMTAAVGANTPYQCGQSLKVRNPAIPGREVIVTVVDKVSGYTPNQINLQRRAFEALGADLEMGVLRVEIIPEPELEDEKWGKYLLEVVQVAYPNYNVIEYNSVDKSKVSEVETKETFEFILQSPQERMKIRGNVTYNPQSDKVISFDLVEV